MNQALYSSSNPIYPDKTNQVTYTNYLWISNFNFWLEPGRKAVKHTIHAGVSKKALAWEKTLVLSFSHLCSTFNEPRKFRNFEQIQKQIFYEWRIFRYFEMFHNHVRFKPFWFERILSKILAGSMVCGSFKVFVLSLFFSIFSDPVVKKRNLWWIFFDNPRKKFKHQI